MDHIGRFGLGILVIKNIDGSNSCEIRFASQYVSEETILMQLEAFLKEREDKYFDVYKEK